ncbi:hypothetical protein ACXZ65_34490 [Streptomyces aculeolatus]
MRIAHGAEQALLEAALLQPALAGLRWIPSDAANWLALPAAEVIAAWPPQ